MQTYLRSVPTIEMNQVWAPSIYPLLIKCQLCSRGSCPKRRKRKREGWKNETWCSWLWSCLPRTKMEPKTPLTHVNVMNLIQVVSSICSNQEYAPNPNTTKSYPFITCDVQARYDLIKQWTKGMSRMGLTSAIFIKRVYVTSLLYIPMPQFYGI